MNGGKQILETDPRFPFYTVQRSFGVSADGSVVVGQALTESGDDPVGFSWTAETGTVHSGISASGVSADGKVVAGSQTYIDCCLPWASTWTENDGWVQLASVKMWINLVPRRRLRLMVA